MAIIDPNTSFTDPVMTIRLKDGTIYSNVDIASIDTEEVVGFWVEDVLYVYPMSQIDYWMISERKQK